MLSAPQWMRKVYGAQKGAAHPTGDCMNIAGVLWNDY